MNKRVTHITLYFSIFILSITSNSSFGMKKGKVVRIKYKRFVQDNTIEYHNPIKKDPTCFDNFCAGMADCGSCIQQICSYETLGSLCLSLVGKRKPFVSDAKKND